MWKSFIRFRAFIYLTISSNIVNGEEDWGGRQYVVYITLNVDIEKSTVLSFDLKLLKKNTDVFSYCSVHKDNYAHFPLTLPLALNQYGIGLEHSF